MFRVKLQNLTGFSTYFGPALAPALKVFLSACTFLPFCKANIPEEDEMFRNFNLLNGSILIKGEQ